MTGFAVFLENEAPRMSNRLTADYRHLLEPWCRFAKPFLYEESARPRRVCYGIGSHGHWSMQAHDTAFAAFAVLAADPATDPARTGASREELRDTALAMLRFTLSTHQTGGGTCTDGSAWGHSWISALGLERMMHGIDALEPFLTEELTHGIRKMLVSEADWLLREYPVKAGLINDNKPESNLWNGALLHRTAWRYPDEPRAAAWREKGTAFLLNAISLPSDAKSDLRFAGKPLREWHVGPNFFPSLACNHHGYLNVGYMVICLSNLAMFHFAARRQGATTPPELDLHARELWALVRACTFPDGRLLRIGGDTRVRYAYCQDYAIPMWLHALDRYGDGAAEQFESGWLGQVALERDANPDGSFMGERLARLRGVSPNYYLRLEGDKACSLSMGAYWRRVIPDFPQTPVTAPEPPMTRWEDAHHGAFFHRSPRRFASWVWEAAEKPQGLCLPPDRSDMAEWRTNLAGRILGVGHVNTNRVIRHSGSSFEGGFATAGRVAVQTQVFVSEGDLVEEVAVIDLAFAALPDSATAVIFQRSRMLHRAYLREWKSLLLQIPNDIQNRRVRRFFWDGGSRMLRSLPRRDERLNLPSRWLNVDDCLGAVILYGSSQFVLHRPGERQITIRNTPSHSHTDGGGGTLYAEEILLHADLDLKAWDKDAVLFDIGCAISSGEKHGRTAKRSRETPVPPTPSGDLRMAWIPGADGATYLTAAHFGETDQVFMIPADGRTSRLSNCRTGEIINQTNGHWPLALTAGECSVWRAL